MGRKDAHLAIETNRTYLTQAIELDRGATRRTIPLTTLEDNQRRALVRVFLVQSERKTLLKEFDLRNLEPGHAGDTRFLLACDYDGKRTLKINLTADGRPAGNAVIDLRKYLQRKRRIAAFTIVLVLLAVLLALLLIRGCATDREPGPVPGPPPPAPVDEPAPVPPEPEPAPAPALPESGETVEAAPVTPAPPETAPAPAPAPTDPPTETIVPVEREVSIYFRPDDPRLTQEGLVRLRELAAEIASWQDRSVTIHGHCALSGTEAGRIELSRQRALNSAAVLLEAAALSEDNLTIEWFGASRLVTSDPDRQELNRRVEIFFSGVP